MGPVVTEHLSNRSQSNEEEPGTLLCQIDGVVSNRLGIFGYGWALDRAGSIVRGTLRLHFKNGRVNSTHVMLGRGREDVAEVFPQYPQASSSGLMFFAGWGDERPETVDLAFQTQDGRTLTAAVALYGSSFQEEDEPWLPAELGRRYLAKQALRYLRQGKIRELISTVRRREQPPRPQPAPEEIALVSRLMGHRCRLVIDHNMGGGANIYRERLVSGWLADGDSIILLSFRVDTMTAIVEVRDADGVLKQTLKRVEMLAAALHSINLVEIFFNCAVSFSHAVGIQRLLLDLKRQSGATLVVAIHEYFVICPSPFLLDKGGTYCGVPSISQCESCLPQHEDGFVSLTGERSIKHWRQMWGEVLAIADEVRCFSQSSKRLLERAYPGIAKHATLRPHDVEPLRAVRRTRSPDSTLTIGVIGFISHHKGATVVSELADAIAKAQADVRIVVFGSLDACSPSNVILQTGPYTRYDLPDLMEQYGVNLALLPSICPETFSFVAHEVISMGLPLICLDLGAQADLARSSPIGRVSPRQDGPGLLQELMAFDHDLYLLNSKVPS